MMKIDDARHALVESKTLRLDCVIPVFNEASLIERFVIELCAYLSDLTHDFRLVLVDDGSRDDSVEKIKTLLAAFPVTLIKLSRNFGKEVALTAGLEHCRTQLDAVLIIDADFQHPFYVIRKFLERWQQGFDMVYGLRDNRQNESIPKRLFTNLFYRLLKRMTQTDIPADAGDFRLLDKKVVAALKQCKERNRFMKGLYAWVGYKSCAVNFIVEERQAGTSQWRFRSLLELAVTGLTSFSSMPLRLCGVVGVVVSALAFLYGSFLVLKTLYLGVDVPGFATIVVSVLFLGGIQLLSMGILGEYIGRIFDEVKQRPHYFVEKTFSSDVHDETTGE